MAMPTICAGDKVVITTARGQYMAEVVNKNDTYIWLQGVGVPKRLRWLEIDTIKRVGAEQDT